jgi:hypothetical protein
MEQRSMHIETSSAKRAWWLALRLVLLALIFIFLGQSVATHWTTVRQAAVNLDWGRFALSVMAFFLALGVLPLPTYTALRAMSDRASFREATAMFFASQGAKYLPGGLWVVPGRVFFYQQRLTIPAIQGSFAILWELFTCALAALLVGMLGASLPDNGSLLPVWMLLALVGVVVVLVGAQSVLAGHFNRWKWFAWISQRAEGLSIFRLRTVAEMTAGSVLFWVLTGLAFYVLLGSAVEDTLSIRWYEATGAYALAWLAGFLVIFLPAGLGVRESVLAMLLAPWFTPGEAIFIAVLARLWWVLAEAVWIVIGLLLLRLPPKNRD